MKADHTENPSACQSQAAHQGLIKSAGTIGLLTAISRILGFIRDVVIATAFGTGVAAEAFVVSFKIPNLLRDLVGEGATNAAFVPVLTDCRERKPEKFWPLVNRLFIVMTAVLTVLTLLGILFAPWVVRLLAPGFIDSVDTDKFPLTVRLTRIIFPYLLFIGLSALAMGVLNALREFKSSALGPIFMNLTMIAAGFLFEKRFGPYALVVGVLVGGLLQLLCQLPPLWRLGFRWAKPDGAGYARTIGKLLLPRALGSAIYQVNVFVDSILASFEAWVGPGGQSALYYSNRLFQLPLAIFGVAIAQAALPTFSTQLIRGEKEQFKRTFSKVIGTVIGLVLPAAAGLAFFSEPIVRILFEHGRFDSYSTQITSRALFFYAWGLLSCALIKLFVNVFYAMQDTRTPVKTMAQSVVLNVCLSFIFMKHLGIGGLALASSISATVNLGLLALRLRRKFGPFLEQGFWHGRLPALTASAVMGVFCYGYVRWVMEPSRGADFYRQASLLLVGIFVLTAAYFFLLRMLGDHTLAWPRKKNA